MAEFKIGNTLYSLLDDQDKFTADPNTTDMQIFGSFDARGLPTENGEYIKFIFFDGPTRRDYLIKRDRAIVMQQRLINIINPPAHKPATNAESISVARLGFIWLRLILMTLVMPFFIMGMVIYNGRNWWQNKGIK